MPYKRMQACWETLSDDVLVYSLRFLSVNELLEIQLTCRRFSDLTQDDAIWSDKYSNYCPYNYENQLVKHAVSNNFKRAYIDLIQREFSLLVNTPLSSIPNPSHMKYVGIDSLLEQTIDETLPNYMKVVTIGAHRAGKTALILTLNNKWTHAFESFYTVYIDQEYLEQEGKQLVLWDTAGEKDYERLRPLCYPITTVFLLCFSICVSRNVAPDESGIAQAVATFIPEARKYCPDVPIILIGTKSDLRNSNVDESTEHVIPSSFGEFLARETGCLAYMEVSAKGKVGIEKVRRAIVRAQKFAPSQKSGKKKCHLQ